MDISKVEGGPGVSCLADASFVKPLLRIKAILQCID